MSTLRKTLASTAIATVLLGGSLAGPAVAGGDRDDWERKHVDKPKIYCEENEEVYRSWWAYYEHCDDEHDDDGKWYLHHGVWYWHDHDGDDESHDHGKKHHHEKGDNGDGWYYTGDGWKYHDDHDHDHDDDHDDDDEGNGKKRASDRHHHEKH